MTDGVDYRLEIALACERFVGNDYRDLRARHSLIIKKHSAFLTPTTGKLVLSAIGTPYEEPLIGIVRFQADESLIAESARLMPGMVHEGWFALYNYAIAITNFRSNRTLEGTQRNIAPLVSICALYRRATGSAMLPCATEEEIMLIDFLSKHPALEDALVEHAKTAKDITPDLLDRLERTAPALMDGLL